ncbi:unnamed protein product [Choristocarpus tenellus]
MSSGKENGLPSNGIEDILTPPDGVVDLRDKVLPVCNQFCKGTLRTEAHPLVFTRGRVDVSKLQKKLLEGGPSIWTAEVWREKNPNNI